MVDQVGVEFTSNASGVVEGADESKEAIASVGGTVQGLIDLFLELGGAATGSFREIRTGAGEAAEGIKGAAEAVTAFREAISGIGEALIAAFAVEQIAEFANKMGEAAEQIQHASQTFGITTGQVQELKAEATATGASLDTLTNAMQRADAALTRAREGSKTASEAFKLLGIDIHAPVDNATLLQEAFAGLSNIGDIATRNGIAMQIFGRNIQALAPIMNLTKDQLADLRAEIERYGIQNDDAQVKGAALAESLNENKVAMQGLGEVMAQALAPAFTDVAKDVNDLIAQFIASYEAGGAAKSAMDFLVISLKAVVAIAELSVKTLGDLAGVIDSLTTITNALTGAVKDAMTGINDFTNGILQSISPLVDFGNMANGAGVDLSGPLLRGITDVLNPLAALNDLLKTSVDLLKQMGLIKEKGPGPVTMKELQDELGPQNKLTNPPNINLKGGKKGKTQDPTQEAMSADTEEWQRIADMAAVITGNANTNMLEAETRFWAEKLAKAKQGSDLWFAILEKLNPLVVQQQEADVKTIQAGVDQEIKEHERYVAALKAQMAEATRIIQQEVDYEVKAHKEAVAKITAEQKQFNKIMDPIVSSFTSGLLKMAEGTESFAQVMRNLGQQILTDFISKVINPMIERWLFGQEQQFLATVLGQAKKNAALAAGTATGTAIQSAANQASVLKDAKAAAAGAYSAVSQIPIIGPFLAPGAAAIAFAAVEAFSAADGFDIPAGLNPVTQLHAREMVLPAPLAEGVRRMSGEGAPPSGGSFGGDINFGDFNVHGGPTGMSPDDFRRALKSHATDVAASVAHALRNGYQPPYQQPTGRL